ncbi:helix-turn-helix domain-containing protein [Enterococcus canintestini]|uniref:Mga helix-turn-helix domain-containing protein n=1 Tax=Enterococcus canintestini TaxID=317010 RepID=A0A267HPV4_9ENTE|nr:helix-turn-helix domain-containing protein [Enterococcus canintestini]PAB00282.1 hypothetical protein AKL21_09835 [Enterococcus canintestini]
MLENYMERELVRKIQLINTLWSQEEMTSITLAVCLNVTSTTIKSDVKAINTYYCETNYPLIVSSGTGYSILDKEKRNKRDFLKQIYNESLFVRACCFYLKSNFTDSETFASLEFISSSKAYELRKNVISYINELDIQVTTDPLINNECRIRFLMVFFQMKVGIDFITINPFSKQKIYELFSHFEEKEKCVLSNYSKEYASILFQLNFDRRKKYPLVFNKFWVTILEQTDIYKRLREPIYKYLINELHVNIQQEEIFYFALVLNIMNANYFDDIELLKSYQSYGDLIKNSQRLNYAHLKELFEVEFQHDFTDDILFESMLITFLRKCIFNLQSLIPEEHIELGNTARIPSDLVVRVTKIFEVWNNENQLNLLFSADHIKYLISKLYFLLQRKNRPRTIYLLTSFYTDYLLAKKVLTEEYGALVTVKQYDPRKNPESYAADNIILYDTEYSFLSKISSQKLQITYILDLPELQKIREFLFTYDLDGIEKNKD